MEAIWAKCALPRSTFLPLIDMWMPPSLLQNVTQDGAAPHSLKGNALHVGKQMQEEGDGEIAAALSAYMEISFGLTTEEISSIRGT